MSKTDRVWGYYRIIHEQNSSTKVKELVIEPGKYISFQKHNMRSELWFVTEGYVKVKLKDKEFNIHKHDYIVIHVGEWHQLINESDKPVHIVEIQFGEQCIEEDIIRD